MNVFLEQGLTKTGDDYEVKAAHVELAERMRKVGGASLMSSFILVDWWSIALLLTSFTGCYAISVMFRWTSLANFSSISLTSLMLHRPNS